MTAPHDGGSEGVSWLDIAASASGIKEAFRRLATEGSAEFNRTVKANAGGANLSAELLAGLDDSKASLAGAKFGEAIGRGIGAPLGLLREVFTGVTRDGTASAEALRTRYNDLDSTIRKTAASIKEMQAQAKDAAASGGVFDASKILAATTALEAHRKEQANVADQIRGTSDAAEKTGRSFDAAGLAAGAMGGLVSAGALIGVAGLGDLIDKAEEAATKLLDVGDTWEQVNRTLQTTTVATSEDLEGLKSVIGDVSEHTSASFAQITGAVGTLSQRTGLRGGALEQLTTDFSDAGVLIGKALDPAKFAAAAAGLNVPADQLDAFLNRLFNESRSTGVGLDVLVDGLAKSGASLSAFGLDANSAASLMALMSKGGIDAGSAMRGLTGLAKEASKAHEGLADYLKQVVGGLVAAKDAGDKAAESYWASKLGKGGPELIEMVQQGTLSVQSLGQAFDNLPTDTLSQVFDSTATLTDKWTEFKNTLTTDLAPVGEALTRELSGSLEKMSDWLTTHGGEVVGWLGEVGDVSIAAFGQVEQFVGGLVTAWGQLEELIGNGTGNQGLVTAGQQAENLGGAMSAASGNIDEITRKFDEFIARTRASVTITENLTAAVKLASDGKGLELKDNSAAVQEDLKNLKQAGVDVTTGPDGKLTFTADTPENQARVQEFLKTMTGHDVDVPVVPKPTGPGGVGTPPADPGSLFGIPPGGIQVPLIPAPKLPTNPADLPGAARNDDGTVLRDSDGRVIVTEDSPAMGPGTKPPTWMPGWLATVLGYPDAPPPPTPPPAPTPGAIPGPLTPDQLAKGGAPGTPPSLRSLLTGGAAPSSYVAVPGQVVIQPAALRTPLAAVLDSAGIAPEHQTPLGVTLPTGLSVTTADPLDPDDLMGRAGVPDKFQGQLPDGGEGVTMPTGFDVKTSDRKSVGDLMESIGIPSDNQGPDGVVLSVSYTQGTSGAGTIPAGFSGPGGPVAGPTSPGQAGMAQAIYAAVLQAGYSPQTAQYAVAASLLESGLDPDITNASGHHGLFQESSDKPSAGALQQIEWFLGELGRQGGPGAVNAYPGGPGAFIADHVEVGGYPGTNYDQFLPQAQTLLAQTPGGAPGTVPAGYTGGGSDYAGVGAGDNASTADPRHGAIPGAPSGEGQPLLATIKSVMDAFNTSTGSSLRVTGDMPGGPVGHEDDKGQHSSRRALDIGGTQQQMDAFVQMWVSNPALLAATRQLIHDDPNNPGIASLNAIGGHLTSGPGTYGDEYAQHQDHIHLALQDVPGAGAGGPASVIPADYTVTNGAGPTVVNVDRITPGLPTTPQPVTPGSQFNTVAPPPGFQPVPQGTPKSVDTPWGSFLHTFDLPPDQQALLTPEQRAKFDGWLNGYTSALEAATDATDAVTKAQQRVDKLLQKKTDADAAADPLIPGSQDAAAAADENYTNATEDLARAKRHALDEQNRQNTESEKPAPWESSKSGKDAPNKDATDLGKGLVKGIFQELGFPDVFGKDPSQWGITKLLGGVGGYGLGLLQNMTQLGGPAAGAASAGAGGNVASGGILGIAEQLLPGLIPKTATNGSPAVLRPEAWNPGGAPAPASDTPAGVGSATPAIVPAGFPGGPGSTTNNPLTVNVTNQGFTPSPQVSDTIRDISNSTSAPAMAGGAGIPT